MQYGPLSGHWEYYPSTKSLTAGGRRGGGHALDRAEAARN